jgi:hypothetical protein
MNINNYLLCVYSFSLVKFKRILNFRIIKIGSNELRFGPFKSQNARLKVR